MAVPCDEHGGRTNNFPLFVDIDRVTRVCKCRRCPVSNFYKRQTIAVEHDEVDFATTGVEITSNRSKVAVDQEVKRQLFCLPAYSSCGSVSHGASSAASGVIGVPSSLMS